MKLRLETGNFKITGTIDDNTQAMTVDSLPKGLSPEDFLGCIINLGTTLFVVTEVKVDPEDDNTVIFGTGNKMLAYNRLTGAVTLY